jgi:hypothetical protein
LTTIHIMRFITNCLTGSQRGSAADLRPFKEKLKMRNVYRTGSMRPA